MTLRLRGAASETHLMLDDPMKTGAAWLCKHCAGLKRGETALILCNESTVEIGRHVCEAARACNADVAVRVVPDIDIHGQEPSVMIALLMSEVDVVFCLTVNSLAHSRARFAATQSGTRFLSLPDYSEVVLSSPALLTDFGSLVDEAERLTAVVDRGRDVHVTSAKGTDLRFSIGGRKGNCAPGLVRNPGTLGSPPDAEVNIAPIEDSCRGIFVVDGSIPCAQIGILQTPVLLEFDNGRVTSINSTDRVREDIVRQLFHDAGLQSRVLGEFGIGLNPNAALSGVMLLDEGVRGTIHLGIGSNSTIGGLNEVAFHLDFIMCDATVSVDDVLLMDSGFILPLTAGY